MNHTPGPWIVIDNLKEMDVIGVYADKGGTLICELRDPEDAADSERMLANAPLIAAAPLMKGQLETGIEAMREALRQAAAGDYDQVHALLSGVIAGNEMAIAQAEGRL